MTSGYAGAMWTQLISIVALCFSLGCADVQIVNSPGDGNIDVQVGSRLELRCQSGDSTNVTWYLNDSIIENTERQSVRVLVDNLQHIVMSVLLIPEVYKYDSGKYECVSQMDISDKDGVVVNVLSYHLNNRVRIMSETGGSVIYVDLGEEFTLRCEARGNTKLIWYHNNQILGPHGSGVVETYALNRTTNIMTSLLTRRSVGRDATGTYTCQEEGAPQNRDHVQVTVTENNMHRASIKILGIDRRPMYVLEGESFELQCRADTQTSIQWYFDNTLASMHQRYVISRQMQENTEYKVSVLTREAADASDSGTFLCRNARAQNDQDEVEISVRTQGELDALNAFDSGSLPTDKREVVLQLGTNIKLSCGITSQSNHKIAWTKGDTDIENSNKFLITVEEPHVLQIFNTERQDVGVYKCLFRDVVSDSVTGVILFNLTTPACPILSPPDFGSFWGCPNVPVLGERCSFRCDPGYRLSSRRPLVCRQNHKGQIHWSEPPPLCKYINPLEFQESVPTSVSNVLLRIGGSLKLQCQNGASWSIHNIELYSDHKYTIEPRAIIIKDADFNDSGIYDCSVFDEEEGTLIGIYKYNVTTLPCPRLPVPDNASMEGCLENPLYGQQCIFSCNKGFTQIRGSTRRTCELASTETRVYWTGKPLECLNEDSSENHSASLYPRFTSILIPLFLLLRSFIEHRLSDIT